MFYNGWNTNIKKWCRPNKFNNNTQTWLFGSYLAKQQHTAITLANVIPVPYCKYTAASSPLLLLLRLLQLPAAPTSNYYYSNYYYCNFKLTGHFQSYSRSFKASQTAAMEALKVGRWTRADWKRGLAHPSYRGHHWKIFENTGAGLCNVVHSWWPVQQKMYNSVFNFGRSIWWHRVIKSGTENWRFYVPLLKVARNLPSLPYRFHGTCSQSLGLARPFTGHRMYHHASRCNLIGCSMPPWC